MKQEVFTPQVVAIGPYHHHQRHLQRMESHKERVLHLFLKRVGLLLDDIVSEMKSIVDKLQASYLDLEEEWLNEDKFLKLMITDGCFMLEVMKINWEFSKHHYEPTDPLFGLHGLLYKVPHMIRRDMLILENQLPILVFQKLISTEIYSNEVDAKCLIIELVVRFFKPSIYKDKKAFLEFIRTIHGFHALDIYLRSWLFIPNQSKQPPIENFVVMRSAKRLHEDGITFQQSNSTALTSINFDSHNGIITLPVITADGNTEYEFLNMVAFEHLHARPRSKISSYIDFMDRLVQSTEDVQLLLRHGLIHNWLGSDEEFPRLFNSMNKYCRNTLGVQVEVDFKNSGSLQVEEYCRKRWNRWRARLKYTYFKDPWSIISVVAAVIVILLAFVSTIFAILQWKNI